MILRFCNNAGRNLRLFLHLRPPLVIFIANMVLFAIALLFLSYWIQYNDMQNPDATKDWNMFLERFASMEVCLTGNKSYPFIRRLSAFTIDGDSAIDLSVPQVPLVAPKLAIHRMNIDVELDNQQRHLLSNYSVLIGAISGKILGLRDRANSYQVINITAVVRQPPRKRDSICIEMVGPQSIFPKTRPPKPCHRPQFEEIRRHLSGGGDAFGPRMSYMYIFKTVYWSSLFFCNSGLPKLRLKYRHNPSLTEMLSNEEKYIAEENLSHTAYAVAVIIACFLSYAAAFGPGRTALATTAAVVGSSGGAADIAARSRNCYSQSEWHPLSDSMQRQQNLEGRSLSSAD